MAVPYPQLVLLGDSLLQQSANVQDGFSFQGALQNHCIRRLDVVNRGFSGWNTANVLQYLDQIIPEPNPSSPQMRYLVILLGANDAVIPLAGTMQHVPIEQYKENLVKIIKHSHVQNHKPTILLVTPPPVDERKHGRLCKQEGFPATTRTSATSASYSEKAREVARENSGVILVDFWQALMDKAIAMTPADYTRGGPCLGSPENGKAGGLDKLLPDGLHMNGDAYRVLYEQIKQHIGHEWTNQDAVEGDTCGYLFPLWHELNAPNLLR
ncbi:hypothetical protein HIM_06534 [Hirsutella minnesotensis 3608]|uniref:SGNH hydrolase-type esterase domain-containing protein n=1 Tax=Hirsutella minnesotensis 3608 TaxID=1043627 RepID=A0A0F7ZNP0_9HYPO|nr:hypothetical protein HIM_06534 [Hirsutella minnesotensis 3608]